jgi:MarR family
MNMAHWGFLTNHARVLLCIAHDPGARLRDIAAGLGITERSAHAIVADLAKAGYVVKQKAGRRNRYEIEAHLPLPEPGTQEPAIGEVLGLLLGHAAGRNGPSAAAAADQSDGPPSGADVNAARFDGQGVPSGLDGGGHARRRFSP